MCHKDEAKKNPAHVSIVPGFDWWNGFGDLTSDDCYIITSLDPQHPMTATTYRLLLCVQLAKQGSGARGLDHPTVLLRKLRTDC